MEAGMKLTLGKGHKVRFSRRIVDLEVREGVVVKRAGMERMRPEESG